jgi:hypothetical protein
MLPNTLNTNEVKNSSGTEVELQRLSTGLRTTEFAKIGETPSLPLRLKIAHQELGGGFKLVRRSKVGFDLTVISDVDNVTPVVISSYRVLQIPIGALASQTQIKNALAYSMSFEASLGASTTILYDCTGNGADVLLNGGL